MLLTNLPTDLIHDILLMLDHRKTLAASISSHRSLREVFKIHPNSILRQVFCNEIGMDIEVLPYAWAHLKYLGDAHLPVGMIPPVKNASPGLENSLTISVKPYTLMGLKQGHQLMRRMAQYYSIRFKDGRVLRDTLTAEESRRFHIAAYLFCHYQTIWRSLQSFHLYKLDDTDHAEENAERPDPQDIKTMEACYRFLHQRSTNELFWMERICDFLLQDIDYALSLKGGWKTFEQAATQDFNRHGRKFSVDFWRHHLLSTSLAYFRHWKTVLKCPIYAPMQLEKEELWLTDAISLVMSERGVMKQSRDDPDANILQSKGILIPACQRCGQEPYGSMNFFNNTNLDDIKVIWDHRRLPGQLASNPIEMGRILARIYHPVARWVQDPRMTVIKEIMAHAEAQATLRLEQGEPSQSNVTLLDDDDAAEEDENEGIEPDDAESGADDSALKDYKWSPDDVLCAPCFSTIFEGLYFAWWQDERQTNRVPAHVFKRQCRLGFECRIQRNPEHSSRFDHCCPGPRARGVAPRKASHNELISAHKGASVNPVRRRLALPLGAYVHFQNEWTRCARFPSTKPAASLPASDWPVVHSITRLRRPLDAKYTGREMEL